MHVGICQLKVLCLSSPTHLQLNDYKRMLWSCWCSFTSLSIRTQKKMEWHSVTEVLCPWSDLHCEKHYTIKCELNSICPQTTVRAINLSPPVMSHNSNQSELSFACECGMLLSVRKGVWTGSQAREQIHFRVKSNTRNNLCSTVKFNLCRSQK